MSRGYNGNNNNQSLLGEICEYIGETVTIFTASGGLSGSGFTGVLIAVNCNYLRLVTRQGSAPSFPLTSLEEIDNGCVNGPNNRNRHCYTNGSECDIPVASIVAFCHNTI